MGASFNKFVKSMGGAFVAVALLFNPLFPVHLSRELWAGIDVATAAMFIAYGVLANRAAS